MIKRIVVGTDGSKTSFAAVDHAHKMAEATGAELVVVAVYDESAATPVTQSAANLAQRALDEVRTRYGPSVRAAARRGAPADAICETAEEEGADLIVVGNVGMSDGGGRFGMSGVPDAVSHHAPCSVLIVHTSRG